MTARTVMVLLLTCLASVAAEAGPRPSLPASSVKTLDGKAWSVVGQRGRVLVLHFWSLGCRPCLEVLPRLRRLDESWKMRDDIALLGLPVDDDLIQIRRHVRRHHMAWTQLVTANGSALPTLVGPLGVGPLSTPSFWVLDVDGSFAGATTDVVKARKAAEQLALNARSEKETKN